MAPKHWLFGFFLAKLYLLSQAFKIKLARNQWLEVCAPSKCVVAMLLVSTLREAGWPKQTRLAHDWLLYGSYTSFNQLFLSSVYPKGEQGWISQCQWWGSCVIGPFIHCITGFSTWNSTFHIQSGSPGMIFTCGEADRSSGAKCSFFLLSGSKRRSKQSKQTW